MIEIAKDWFSVHDGLKMLDWNKSLISKSFPFECIKLPIDLVEDMLKNKDRFDDFSIILNPILEKLGCQNSFFIKLITRSPKDYLDDNFEIKSLECAYNALISSIRTFDDLVMLRHIDMCYVIIRPFVEIKRLEEFRVLVYGKQIVGISQYYYHDGSNIKSPESREIAIRNFVINDIIPNVAVNHFVADIFFDKWLDPVLIELNPFGLSDPCLFMDYSSLDGTFKYNKN